MDPAHIRYTSEHDWVAIVEEGVGLVGVTDYAQDQLGDVVYLDLPQAGTGVEQFKKMGEIESVKAVSDLYSPVSGSVVEVNPELEEHPELVNRDPYGEGWLLRVHVADTTELENLMTHAQYQKMLEEAG